MLIGSESNPCSFAELRSDYKKFAAKTKRRRDKRSPCLTPLLQWKTFPRTPFKSTDEVPKLKIKFIH